MIWLILGCVVGLLAAVGLVRSLDPYDGLDWSLCSFLGLLAGIFVAALVCFGLNGLMLPILGGNQGHHTATYRLQAIAARSDIHGEFFLGSGQVDSSPAYRYYRITANGGFVLDSADASSSVVYQDSSQPRVIDRWIEPAHPWWCFFNTGHETYEIHVPQGSITATTNLDLP